MKNPYLAPAVVLFLCSGVLIALGVVTFLQAPDSSKAATALIVPLIAAAIIDVIGVAVLRGGRSPALGKNALVVGILFCMVAAGVVGGQAYKRFKAQERYLAAKEDWDRAVTQGKRPDNPDSRQRHFEVMEAPDHDTQYVVNGMIGIAAACGVTFLLLLAMKTKLK